MNNVMIDLVTLTRGSKSPLCAIEAVFFEPSTGKIGAELYRTINIRNASGSNGAINIDTAFEWMKKDAADRVQLIEAKESERDAIYSLRDFLNDNTLNLQGDFYFWFKNLQEKESVFFSALNSIGANTNYTIVRKYRDLELLLDLAKVTGYTPHASNTNRPHTITKAHYQAEQVCEIWQRLTSPYFESL